MAVRRLRSVVSRLVLVAGLGAMLSVGSVAVSGPSQTSAKPMSCEVAMNIAWGYLGVANTMYNLGYMNQYYYYLGKYESLADAFYPC